MRIEVGFSDKNIRVPIVEQLESYNFHQAGRTLRIAIKDEFCDWWIEAANKRLHEHDPEAAWTALEGLRKLLLKIGLAVLRILAGGEIAK